mgnify:CR=1 FL=1
MSILMANKKIFILKLLFIPIVFLCYSCRENKPKQIVATRPNPYPVKDAIQKGIDSSKLLLKNGDVVFRRGNDVISHLFSEMNTQDKSFSHCGIAFEENGKWFVFHSIGGEDNPDEKLRKEPFENFITPKDNTGFGICDFSFTSHETQLLKFIVDSLYKKEIPFDMQFDLKTNDKLYCAEMVAKAIQLTLKNDSFFSIHTINGFQFYSTDNIFTQEKAKLICKIDYK